MPQTLLYILGILGAALTVMLSINAYFVKSLLESLNQVKLQTAILIERSEAKEKRLQIVEEELKDLNERYHELARR